MNPAGLQHEEEKTSTSAVKWSVCGFVCGVGDILVYICTVQVEKKSCSVHTAVIVVRRPVVFGLVFGRDSAL